MHQFTISLFYCVRYAKEHQVGKEIGEESGIPDLLEGFDNYFEQFESKEITEVLRKIKSKMTSVKKLLNFSKTQILYEKNKKLVDAGFKASKTVSRRGVLGSKNISFAESSKKSL